MLNTLDDYICRSISDSEPFSTNPNLVKKVDKKGRFREFTGNTTVFLLDESTKSKIGALRDELYAAAGFMLADPLQTATFHLTLHDLVNGPTDAEGIADQMKAVSEPAKALIQGFRQQPPLKMRTTWMFNMVNTSIVLGLKPVDADGEQRLGSMYQAFEKILPLGYALTPHITLAYFLPGTYTAQEAAKLSHALRPVDLDIELRMENLVLQNFLDMNHYESVF
jgi:hypothetical protein